MAGVASRVPFSKTAPMTTTRVRFAEGKDAEAIYGFIYDLATYEKQPEAVKTTPAQIRAHLESPRPPFECLVAEQVQETGAQAVGFALFFQTYSTWTGVPGLWLEDLFVDPGARGSGAGSALLQRVAELAVARGFARLDLTALDWNRSAIEFYLRRGATAMDTWTTHRFEGEALKRLADGTHAP